MIPVRFQLRRTKGFRMADAVDNGLPCRSVARPGPFGNPWTIAETKASGLFVPGCEDEVCLNEYRSWLYRPESDKMYEDCSILIKLLPRLRIMLSRLPELRNTNLGCYCKLCDEHAKGKPCGVVCDKCAPCHADILLVSVSELPV